jgi:hypothetical protein
MIAIREADRGADGKLYSDRHSAHAREHMLAASIAMSTGDHDEAIRRMDSARIHISHSQHAKAQECGQMMEDAQTLLKNGNADKANSKIDAAYGALQGDPAIKLDMKRKREGESAQRTSFVETLTFHPHFLEGSYDPRTRSVDVIIVTEGMGNKRDKHFYTREAIADAVKNRIFESEQAYADHPSKFDDANRPERSVRDLIGYYYDSKLVEVTDRGSGKRVAAYGAKFKIQQGLDWVEGIIREAIDFQKRFPDKTYVGISINADGDTVPTERDGDSINEVVRITEAFSADMVTKPARGGGFLRLVEGAGGAQQHKEDNGMNKLLDAASKLEKLAEGEQVDPADLKQLAKTIRESNGAAASEAAGDVDDLSKKGSSDNKVGLNEKDVKVDVDGDGDDDSTPEGDTDEDVQPPKKKDDAATAKESAAAQRGGLRESVTLDELKTKFPSLYQAALREAQASVSNDVTKLRNENAQLKAKDSIRESIALAKGKLSESKIPEGGFDRMLQQMIGLSGSEMDDVISAEERYLESVGLIGARRVGGNGERVGIMRGSDVQSTTAQVLAGLTEA